MRRLVEAMTDRLQHRGPDATGSWIDAGQGVAVGHRRLSIIDVSEAGAQPMVSANGRFVMSYNGEIYDTAALRQQLQTAGYPFGAFRHRGPAGGHPGMGVAARARGGAWHVCVRSLGPGKA